MSGRYIFPSSSTSFTGGTIGSIEPIGDNVEDIGSPLKRFRSLNTVNGVAVNFTATTKIQLGSRELTEHNIIITGDTVDGGNWN